MAVEKIFKRLEILILWLCFVLKSGRPGLAILLLYSPWLLSAFYGKESHMKPGCSWLVIFGYLALSFETSLNEENIFSTVRTDPFISWDNRSLLLRSKPYI